MCACMCRCMFLHMCRSMCVHACVYVRFCICVHAPGSPRSLFRIFSIAPPLHSLKQGLSVSPNAHQHSLNSWLTLHFLTHTRHLCGFTDQCSSPCVCRASTLTTGVSSVATLCSSVVTNGPVNPCNVWELLLQASHYRRFLCVRRQPQCIFSSGWLFSRCSFQGPPRHHTGFLSSHVLVAHALPGTAPLSLIIIS